MNPIRRLLVLLVAATALLGATAGTAAAELAEPPSAQRVCPINVGGFRGEYICEYDPTVVIWPGDQAQVFVIGTDFAVWNILENRDGSWSGWRSLGGAARSKVHVNAFNGTSLDIRVLAADLTSWCDLLPRLGGPWNAWRRC